MEFLPFPKINLEEPCVVVDSRHPAAVQTLSHWRGAEIPFPLWADTSTEIVLKALHQQVARLDAPYVTNNHFDVDGGLGIWALLNPDLAMTYAEVLAQAARIGDFREYDPNQPGADLALKLVCWLNGAEQRHFYAPFEERQEAVACVEKYAYFLPRIGAMLLAPQTFQNEWELEYQQVLEDRAALQERGVQALDADLRLLVVRYQRPLHYYALFGASRPADMVLMQFGEQRYELEYKYTTWVDTAERRAYPRLPFAPLAQRLNALESAAQEWQGQGIMDTGPALRLGGESLTKAQRFAHPFERDMASSSMAPDLFLQQVKSFFQEAYARITPQWRWTWEAMRKAATEAGITLPEYSDQSSD